MLGQLEHVSNSMMDTVLRYFVDKLLSSKFGRFVRAYRLELS